MKNKDIRQAIENAHIRYWQVAEKLGINDGSFSRKLRKELSESEKKKVFAAISEIIGGDAI